MLITVIRSKRLNVKRYKFPDEFKHLGDLLSISSRSVLHVCGKSRLVIARNRAAEILKQLRTCKRERQHIL